MPNPIHNSASSIRLTEAERSRIRMRVLEAMPSPVASPYLSYFPQILFSRPLAAVLASAVIVVSLGGTAYAAEGALPGDALYTVKVNVNEPVAGALAVSDEAKAAWHADVAETRLAEAEALAEKGTLDATTSAKLAEDFNAHADAVSAIAEKIGEKEPAERDRVRAAFSAGVAKRGAAILAISKNHDEDSLKVASALVVNATDHEDTYGPTLAISDAKDTAESEDAAKPAETEATAQSAAPVAMMKAAPMRAAFAIEAQHVSVEPVSLEEHAKSALAEATSTLSSKEFPDDQRDALLARVAAIENRIVKADAERAAGDEEAANADYAAAIRAIAALVSPDWGERDTFRHTLH